MAQAIDFINGNDMSVGELLRNLTTVKEELLKQDLPIGDVHEEGVCMMVHLAMERLLNQSEVISLLHHCSFLHGDCILVNLVETMVPDDQKLTVDLIRRSGLLTVEGVDSNRHFVMHRLIQEVVRLLMGTDAGPQLTATAAHIVSLIYLGFDELQQLTMNKPLLLHMIELVRLHETSYHLPENAGNCGKLLAAMGVVLNCSRMKATP